MLNEKKIRLMTRTAIYEKREGKEDLKVNSYCGSDYVRFNMLKTLIGVTIAVFLCSCIYVLYSSQDLLQMIFKVDLLALAKLLITAYVLSLIVYVISSVMFYQYKYSRAKKRLKHFNHNLSLIDQYSQDLSVNEETGGKSKHD